MNISLLFRILTGILLIIFMAHRAYYIRKYPPSETETIERQGSNLVSTIASLFAFLALVSTLIYIIVPGLIRWASLPFAPGLRALGLVSALLGFALLEWSHRALSANWSDQPRITERQKLVENGPYRWIRHPMYTSFLLILGATLFLSANWFVGLSWIAMVCLDAFSRIRYEERVLHERFGDEYERYRRRTGMLLPKL